MSGWVECVISLPGFWLHTASIDEVTQTVAAVLQPPWQQRGTRGQVRRQGKTGESGQRDGPPLEEEGKKIWEQLNKKGCLSMRIRPAPAFKLQFALCNDLVQFGYNHWRALLLARPSRRR